MPIPSEDECLAYFTSKGRPDLCSGFWDYWQSVGWRRRGSPVVDWQATVRTWIARSGERPQTRITVGRGTPPSMTLQERAAAMMARHSGGTVP